MEYVDLKPSRNLVRARCQELLHLIIAVETVSMISNTTVLMYTELH